MKYKGWIALGLASLALAALAGCGAEQKAPDDTTVSEIASASAQSDIDVDLTLLSSTMVYSEVYHMMAMPSDYIGKTVKMRGEFAVTQDEETQQYYFAVIIADATACCQQGIEFVWNGSHAYPDDYPAPGQEVTVVGVFNTYTEDGVTYRQLMADSVTF